MFWAALHCLALVPHFLSVQRLGISFLAIVAFKKARLYSKTDGLPKKPQLYKFSGEPRFFQKSGKPSAYRVLIANHSSLYYVK